MKSKLLSEAAGQRTFALIFQTGDEVMENLNRFAVENRLAGSHFTAIGAFSRATVAYFNWEQKKYQDIPIDEQVEVLMLAGDIAEKDDKPVVHAHVVLGTSSGQTRGGHLRRATVRPTLELILTESPTQLRKTFDPESGLALITVE